jgi:hypothetical protein
MSARGRPHDASRPRFARIELSGKRANHDRDSIDERGRVVSVKTGKFDDIRMSGTNDGEFIASPKIQASFHNIF